MPARLTLHPPQRASRFLVVRDGETLVVGREAACDLVLEDSRVSKTHAELTWRGAGWTLRDLGSKNGTWLNGRPAAGELLAHGDWISFGGVMGRFERLTEEEALSLDHDRLARLQTSIEMRRRLGEGLEPFDLLLRFLESAVAVVGAERGFVLLKGTDGSLRVEAASGLSLSDAEAERFGGSTGALDLALTRGEAVVVADVQKDAGLGRRPSVVDGGLRAVASLPIRHEGEVVGVLYVDSRKLGTFTELDVQILESLAEHAAIAIASIRLERKVRALGPGP